MDFEARSDVLSGIALLNDHQQVQNLDSGRHSPIFP